MSAVWLGTGKRNMGGDKLKQVWKNQVYLWRLCFKTAPGFMIYWIYDGIRFQGVTFLEHAIGVNLVLESAQYGKPFLTVLIYMVALIAFIAVEIAVDGYFIHNMVFKNKPKLYRALKEPLFEKASKLDLSCYDDPEYYDKFVLSVSESEKSIDRFLDMLRFLSISVTGLVTGGIFFLYKSPIGLVFVAISFILSFFFAKKRNKVNFDVRTEVNPYERKRYYSERVFYLNEYAKELRLNDGIGDVLEKQFDEANDKIVQINRDNAGKRWLFQFLQRYISKDFIVNGVYISLLVVQAAVFRTISFGSAVVLFHLVRSMSRQLNDFSEVLPKAAENSLYVDKIREFMVYEPVLKEGIGEEAPKGSNVLEVKNLSFAYNEKAGNILHNINMVLKPGEKVALVGYNGAGKTTLIKLLMRLYDPTSGEVCYAGKSIDRYDLKSFRDRIGVVFQDYKIYGAALNENVVMDDLSMVSFSKDEILSALKESGFSSRLNKLKYGLETQLTTEFDEEGVDLSGGESQKVAISRAFYQNADIIVMDEPSSALDPIAEYSLNKAMKRAAKGKTVVYISHRLSTTKDADRIYMLEEGRLIEEGTHEELLELNGKYADMWNAQAQYYISSGA